MRTLNMVGAVLTAGFGIMAGRYTIENIMAGNGSAALTCAAVAIAIAVAVPLVMSEIRGAHAY